MTKLISLLPKFIRKSDLVNEVTKAKQVASLIFDNNGSFVFENNVKSYLIKGHKINLILEPEVFSPSEHGIQIANYISVNSEDRVLDMGTGTGLLGIIAAKEGAINVDVSDSSHDAVALATKNAILNNVFVKGYDGRYFCTPNKTYDYIIANLPQEIIPTEYAEQIGELEKTISGGPKGNVHLLKFLEEAHKYMHDKSRALIAVYSVSDYLETLNYMKSLYAPKLLDVITSPAKEFVQDNISYYKPLIERGEVGLFQKNGVWQSTIFVYEIRKK